MTDRYTIGVGLNEQSENLESGLSVEADQPSLIDSAENFGDALVGQKVVAFGVDLVDIGRLQEAMLRQPKLKQRLFTDAERGYSDAAVNWAERYAARFAAKEATMKALGVGLGGVQFADIEVAREDSGRPRLILHGEAREIALGQQINSWLLTISHSETITQALVAALR